MSNFWLHIEPKPGCDISDCANEAIRIAELLGVTVSFDFNGVQCGARTGDDPKLLVENYHNQIRRGHKIKVAYANPLPEPTPSWTKSNTDWVKRNIK